MSQTDNAREETAPSERSRTRERDERRDREITATGKTKFHHRSATHDDRLWAVGLAVYGARHDIEPYHPVILFGSRKDFLGRVQKPSWTDWVKKLRGESKQDKYDQALTTTNLNARALRKDPKAILGMGLHQLEAFQTRRTR